MVDSSKKDWASIIYRGVESETLDYKAAQNWRDLNRREKSKFVRHCLAMANTRGGYVVVGVGEDRAGKPSLYTGLTDEQLKSFDPSDVGAFINHRADPPIDFEIVRPTVDGKTYVIFVVKRFRDLPHVASGQVDDELHVGCFYIRTADASSRIAYRAAEIHDLVQRSLRNQREVLGRMIRGLLYEKGLNQPEPLSDSLFSEEMRHAEAFLQRGAKRGFSKMIFEMHAKPSEYEKRAFGLSEIKAAITTAHDPFKIDPLMAVDDEQKTYFTNVSLRSLSLNPDIYFQAFRSGQFHYQRAVPNGEGIPVDGLIHLVVGSLLFLGNYYIALNSDDKLVTITLFLKGVQGKHVVVGEQWGEPKRYICRIPEIRIELKRSVADLEAGLIEHATRVFHDIFIRFNVPESRQEVLRTRIKTYLEGLSSV